MSWKRFLHQILSDDRAQATTEYILILAIAISIFVLVYMNFLKPFFQQYEQTLTNDMNNLWFPANFHYFPVHP